MIGRTAGALAGSNRSCNPDGLPRLAQPLPPARAPAVRARTGWEVSKAMSDETSAGFELFTRPSPLLDPWRPLYAQTCADRMVFGLRLREPHTNSRATAHGGLIAALADQAMGMSCGVKLRGEGVAATNLWTTSLTIDYLGAARIGQWLIFDTTFAHVGKTICHAEIDVRADDITIARGRGAFRVTLS